MTLPNTIFLDNNGEVVVDILSVREPARTGWPERWRSSVVMIGVGLQMGTSFTITQWASDWERELLDAARPTLALANKVYAVDLRGVRRLAGRSGSAETPYWPTMDLRDKTMAMTRWFKEQGIEPNARENDIMPDQVERLWKIEEQREAVWRHNYWNVLDTSMRVFQIEWPEEET